jgi:hypothetical protein
VWGPIILAKTVRWRLQCAMAQGDKPGTVKIAEPRRWWAAFWTLLIAFLPVLLLVSDDPNVRVHDKHVLAEIAFLAGAAVAIWGCYRAWRMGLQLDDHGVTVRNFFRTHRISWAEVRCFADGSVYAEAGSYNWALAVVLHDGRVVTAKGTARNKDPRPETLTAVQQAAERYAIPATLTGTPMRRGSPANPGGRRKHKKIDQARTASAGLADAGDGTAIPSDDREERPAAG